jgi:hypothetical protein
MVRVGDRLRGDRYAGRTRRDQPEPVHRRHPLTVLA